MHGSCHAGWAVPSPPTIAPNNCPCCAGLFVVQSFLRFSGFFNLHIAELLGVKDLATLHALDILGVFVPGNDTYLGVLADGCHRFGFVKVNFSFRKIVAVFSTIWKGFLVNLSFSVQILPPRPQNDSGAGLEIPTDLVVY